MNRLVSTPVVRMLLALSAAMLAVVMIPGAEALEVKFSEGSSVAYPEGDAATVPIRLEYLCEDFLGGDDNLEVVAEVTEGSGTATVSPASVAIIKPPTCTVGQTQTSNTNLSVSTTKDVMAGQQIVIKVTATANAVGSSEVTDDGETIITVGPFVDVVFQANSTALQIPAGSQMNESISVISNSNDAIMVMTAVPEYPEGWPRPSLGTPFIDPVEGAAAEGSLDFSVAVPSDAQPGDYPFIVSLFAHSTTDATVQTDTVELLYTVNVVQSSGGAGGAGDEEDSPGPVLPAMLLVLLAGAALRRRRA